MAEAVKQRKRFVIIDGKSVFYRGYYAMPNLSTKDGTATGGVFGFATMALEVLRKLKPEYVAVAWDKPKTNIRKRLEMYPEYKAGRKPAPPDFYEQIPLLHELLEAFGWPLYELDDYEADDIMGALALQARDKNIETLLVTSDLDVLQLVNGHVHAYMLKKGLSNIEEFDEASFKAKYGIDVEQFVDLKALKGDSSDNIPGVPGVGEKTAIELLQKYKTLASIYNHLDEIKESVRLKLQAGKDSAILSKKVVTLMTNAPIKLNLSEVDGSQCDPRRVQEILQRLEFRTLARQLPEAMQVPNSESRISNVESSDFRGGKLEVIDSADKLTKMAIRGQAVIHSLAAGKHGRNPQVLILSPNPKTVYALDLTKLDRKAIRSPLSALRSVVGYDTKSTFKVLMELQAKLPVVDHDVLMGGFLLNPLRREQTLTELAQSDLGYEGSSLDDLTPEELIQRAPEIVAVIRALYENQSKELPKLPKLARLTQDVEWPVIPVIAQMEYLGIKLNTNYLKQFSVQIEDIISDLQQQIYGHADQEFNISSPAQLADILFTKLNLSKEGIKRGKTGYSTAASELDKLRGVHPVVDLITQYREVTKLKNTYVDTLPKQVDENSRVHTTYNMAVAPTGRLSSVDPNLQNIPVRTELGKHIRTAFEAEKGNVLVSADYSQFELRLAAYLCNDKTLIDQFNRDVDVHTATAEQIYGREIEDVTKNMRRDAKVVNFGVMYGLSPHGLSVATGMTHEAAKHFIDRYFEVRPKLLAYIDSVKEMARTKGYVETILGRRRPSPDVHSSNFAVREAALRAAVNMPFQGSAADIMKLAMVAVSRALANRYPHSKILLQIHDSLIVEAPESEAEAVAALLKQTMEKVYKLPVKLTVETSIGKNWGEL